MGIRTYRNDKLITPPRWPGGRPVSYSLSENRHPRVKTTTIVAVAVFIVFIACMRASVCMIVCQVLANKDSYIVSRDT